MYLYLFHHPQKKGTQYSDSKMNRLRRVFAPRDRYEPIATGDVNAGDADARLARSKKSPAGAPFSRFEYSVFLLLGVSMLWAWYVLYLSCADHEHDPLICMKPLCPVHNYTLHLTRMMELGICSLRQHHTSLVVSNPMTGPQTTTNRLSFPYRLSPIWALSSSWRSCRKMHLILDEFSFH